MAQRYRTVFAALDGSSTQAAVAGRAIAIAASNHADLVFGHVVDSVPYESSGVNFEALRSDCKARIEEEMADVFAEARNNPNIPSVTFEVAAGRVTEALATQLIEPAHPDLIVCGERGLSNIKYAFVGSVSTFLIRNMDCDVLVVKQR